LLLFDEAGVIFPKAWNQKMIDSLAYQGGVDKAEEDNRPPTWDIAWQKQRHWNWDIILTAPNIKYIRDDIRQTTESAFKHRNKALFGPMFKGYKEGQHDGQKDGKAYSDFESVRDKRVSALAFELYDSTKTGLFTETLNGFNIFASPRIVILLAVTFGAIYFSLSTGGLTLLPEKINGSEVSSTGNVKNGTRVQEVNNISSQNIVENNKANIKNKDTALADFNALSKAFNTNVNPTHTFIAGKAGRITSGPLDGAIVYISGSAKLGASFFYTLTFVDQRDTNTYLSSDLTNIGYSVEGKDHCSAVLKHNNQAFPITCILISS
jgi:zona occludens toxin